MKNSFCVLQCDTKLFKTNTDVFLDLVRRSLTGLFNIALKPSFLVTKYKGSLILCQLQQKTRNILQCSVYYLGKDLLYLHEASSQIKDAISSAGFEIFKHSLLKYMGGQNQLPFRNYIYVENAPAPYLKEIQHKIFNSSINKSIFKEMYVIN